MHLQKNSMHRKIITKKKKRKKKKNSKSELDISTQNNISMQKDRNIEKERGEIIPQGSAKRIKNLKKKRKLLGSYWTFLSPLPLQTLSLSLFFFSKESLYIQES